MIVTILRDVKAAPDHNFTRDYKAGEVYEIDKVYEVPVPTGLVEPAFIIQEQVLMPQWLADALTAGGYFHPVKGFTAPKNEGITHVPMREAPAALLGEKGR